MYLFLANGWDLCDGFWSAACTPSLSVRPTKKIIESHWRDLEEKVHPSKLTFRKELLRDFTPYSVQEAASPGQPSRHSSAPQSQIAAFPQK